MTSKTASQGPASKALDLAMLFLLALASAWFLYSNFHFVQRAAIPGLDEGVYFHQGRGLWLGQAPDWSWSPAFAPLYALLAWPGAPEQWAVPGMHYFLQTAGMFLFYAYVRAWMGPWAAAAFGIALGFSPYLLPTFNIYGFCTLWLLSCLLALRMRPRLGLGLLALGPWVRGEYAVFSGLALAAAWWWRPQWRRPALLALALLVLGAAFILPKGASRSTLTFRHHYAWSMKDQGKIENQWTQGADIVAKDFGPGGLDVKVSDYARMNPPAFRAYLWHNASLSLVNLWEAHNIWLEPANEEFKASRIRPVILSLVAALIFGLISGLTGRALPTTARHAGAPFELWMTSLGLLALMLGPWILFRPQHEYFAAMRPITLGWLAWACPILMVWVWGKVKKLRN